MRFTQDQINFVNNLQLGSDFEVPIYNSFTKSFVSAQGIVPGTKEKPESFHHELGLALIQADCTNVEFNTNPINLGYYSSYKNSFGNQLSTDFYLVVRSIVDSATKQYIKTFNENLKLLPRASAILKKLENPNDWVFGCDPDFNAWKNGEQNEKPDVEKLKNKNLRTAATHFHFSHPSFGDRDQANRFARLFDVFVTLPVLLIDKDTKRRQLYGKAGAIRYTQYGDKPGIEIRTISSNILKHKNYIRMVFFGLFDVIQKFVDGYDTNDMIIPKIINTHDIVRAKKVIEYTNNVL